MSHFKLGFVINPVAGLGGSVALKGSDGMTKQALSLGAEPKANERARSALEILTPYKDSIIIYTASQWMGEFCAKKLGFNVELIYKVSKAHTTAEDTNNTVIGLLAQKVDLILFAGGDGTARNIADLVIEEQTDTTPVLGIPAGCKIHSGVYAITPKAAGRVVEMMVIRNWSR